LPGGGRRRKEELLLNGYRVLVGDDEKVLETECDDC
jgi:hypothetical protein